MPAPKKNEYAGSDFVDPLLKSLGILTGLTAFKPVNLKETYPGILAEMEMAEDDFGHLSAQVRVWIQEAFKTLKRNGLGTSKDSNGTKFKRGSWALTPGGVRQAKDLISDDEAEYEIPAEENLVPTLAVESNEDKGSEPKMYHPDPYIRSLAAEQTPCYGNYDEEEDACTQCTLSEECIRQFQLEFEIFAKKADEPEEEQEPEEEPEPEETTKDLDLPDDLNVVSMENLVESICLICGNVIPEGETINWVRSTSTGQSGTCHLTCWKNQ